MHGVGLLCWHHRVCAGLLLSWLICASGDPLIAPFVCVVQAQNVTSVKALLESRNYKLAAALVEAANMTKVLSSPNARYTVFM